MSVFHLNACVNGSIDSRYIQSFDVVVSSTGYEDFDVLTQAYHGPRLFLLNLHHVDTTYPGNQAFITNVQTNYQPFLLQLITNVNNPSFTTITITVKNQGNVLAVFGTEHFTIVG
ncbi:hypothetical protein NV379_21265 [Paenibacillus sp. N1-5-1-14]|uniref:hypothetical protein n=1 Tax=Paenibacillus radicibacter TaxID=2972488 RepID=UPI002158E44E|nr:hypothetical protein [Paenibacillus radicibacter]MCR8645188.1 hypothetical protein [Paenibacillus radicibacter]